MIKDKIQKNLEKALEKIGAFAVDVDLYFPADSSHGDYATSIALKLAKQLKKNPLEIAKLIADNLEKDLAIEKVEIVKPGFINFWLSNDTLLNQSAEIIRTENFDNQNKKILLEFGQPNTHKIPHIGHLFSYIYGATLARILEITGNHVTKTNYQGDVGLHVAKCLYKVKSQKAKIKSLKTLREKVDFLQLCYQEGSAAYEKDEEAKKEIDELNKKIYENDASITALWKQTRKWSIDFYRTFEKELGVDFKRYYFESETSKLGKEIVEKNIGKVFQKSQGAVIFPGEKYGLHTRVFINKYGNPTYEAKDIGLAALKKNENQFDESIITTASEQKEYWRVVKKAIELVFPDMLGKINHISFGMINLTTGKMASRTGQILNPFTLIKYVEDSIAADYRIEDDLLLKKIAFAAIKYSFLNSDPKKNITFDLKKSIAKEGNSGPYLLYTYVRCQSVLNKVPRAKFKVESYNSKLKINNSEKEILRKINYFPEIVEKAASDFSPHFIASYIFELAQKYNLFYQKNPILKAGKETKNLRLFLTNAVSLVIKKGLYLLGIETVEKM